MIMIALQSTSGHNADDPWILSRRYVSRFLRARSAMLNSDPADEQSFQKPCGEPLDEAIEQVDAETANGPAYYMINCAHPTHFEQTLAESGTWLQRIRGIRANASKRCHQELNDIPDLDSGDPIELGNQYRDLVRRHRHINVLGGCCGTDHRHVRSISEACRGL